MDPNQITICNSPSGVSFSYGPGDILGESYVLTRLIGRGAMGSVYECKHKIMGKTFALKLLTGGLLNTDAWLRFQAEGKALARLKHPGIVTIYNMGIEAGHSPYYVMELIPGRGLDVQLERSGALDVEQVLKIAIQVADALGCAHQNGIIHRDVKPSNLMLTYDLISKEPTVKLVDFGIARLSSTHFAVQSKTSTGAIFGTPYYMSPEQCLGQKVDERSDIYSLGCTLFEALTGTPPFCGESSLQTLMMHQHDEPPTLQSKATGRTFAPGLDLAVKKMLSKEKSARYQSMQQLSHDLERIMQGKPIIASAARKDRAHPDDASAKDDIYPDPAAAHKQEFPLKAALVSLTAALTIAVAIGAVFLRNSKPSQVTSAAVLDKSELPNTHDFSYVHKEELAQYGATRAEINSLRHFPGFLLENAVDTFAEEYEINYFNHALKWSKSQRPGGLPVLFTFPKDIYLGILKIDDNQPILAHGDIAVKPGCKAVFYTRFATRHYPDLLKGFGPSDLTGLEMVFHHKVCTGPGQLDDRRFSALEAMKTIKTWKRLEELSFFDSLIKSVPNHEEHDESTLYDGFLPTIDQFTQLKSLGLCGENITGNNVARMSLLNKLNTLKLKRISGIIPLLYRLGDCDNIKEVWLFGQKTDDAQLRLLTRMKNLETLHIRWSLLTPDSLAIFKQMPALRHLVLDKNNWSEADKARFKEGIADCRFEPVLDTTYWASFSDEFARKNFPEQFKY